MRVYFARTEAKINIRKQRNFMFRLVPDFFRVVNLVFGKLYLKKFGRNEETMYLCTR
ncbi:hypothetical protein JCM10003_1946 [Bacteroides pyogenes JCM 10003]|nr:hypothetical protein JCM10003_1946 [Bacteroides pyogenes JCM 10003]